VPAPENIDTSLNVAIYHTGTWSFFRFTTTVVELIQQNRDLRHNLQRLGELNGDTLRVAISEEADVVTLLTNSHLGLRIIHTTPRHS
jgi:hypothetical protein